MEAWERDFHWQRIRHLLKARFRRESLPDLNAILFIIGIQELGRWKQQFTKEEKQDLMHIAVCRLLSTEGYYEFIGRDADGWPHYELRRPVPGGEVAEQEALLQAKIIEYFEELENETGPLS